MCDEIINAMDIVSTNVTDTISTNIKSNVAINSGDKRVRYKMDCCILHKFSVVIMLLLTVAIICHHYTKYRSKQKRVGPPTI